MRHTATGNSNSQKPEAGMRTTPVSVSRPKNTMKDQGIATPERSSCAASRPMAINANHVTRNQKIRHLEGGESQTPIRPAFVASTRSRHPAMTPKRL